VDGAYLGEPLLEIEGRVLIDPYEQDTFTTEDYNALVESLRIAMFWSGEGGGIGEEQQVLTRTAFPMSFSLQLFSPPRASSLIDLAGVEGEVAVGAPILYLDEDGDGSWDPRAEGVVGSGMEVILYGEAPFEVASAGGGSDRLLPGFYMVEGYVDTCESQIFPTRAGDDAFMELYIGALWDDLIDVDCGG